MSAVGTNRPLHTVARLTWQSEIERSLASEVTRQQHSVRYEVGESAVRLTVSTMFGGAPEMRASPKAPAPRW